MALDLGFSAAYAFEVLPGLPGTGPAPYQFARSEQRTHSEGLVVRVEPREGEAWVGNFQGVGGDSYRSVVFATPSPDHIGVVSDGVGYRVRADAPTEYEVMPSHPIRDVRRVPGRDMVVLADFTNLVAYGPEGLLWCSKRLGWDDLEIRGMTAAVIQVVTWDPTIAGGGDWVSFSVDTATGRAG